jgi:hypothetical protein
LSFIFSAPDEEFNNETAIGEKTGKITNKLNDKALNYPELNNLQLFLN